MTYNRKNIFAISAIAAVLALSPILITEVLAEEVTVDIPASENRHLFECSWWTNTPQLEDIPFTYVCIWNYPITTEEFRVITGELESPQLEDLVGTIEHDDSPSIIVEEQVPLTEVQQAIKRLEGLKEEGKIMPSENEVLRLLLDAQKRCEFGIEEGEAIQTYAYFDIPKSQIDITRSFNYDRNHLLSSIAKLIESCDNWNTYKTYNLGPEYTNKVIADRDEVEREFKRLAELHALSYTYDTLTPHDLEEAKETAYNTVCSQEGFSNYVKSNYGCEDLVEDENRGGFVDVSASAIMQDYWRFQDTGDIEEKPRSTTLDYVGPDVIAYEYWKAYGYLPEQMQQELTVPQLEKLFEKIAESIGDE